jgi:DNA-binding NarL/FixJ family response regulator
MSRSIRVLIADDHAVVRQGLSQICNAEPDMQVVGQAADGQEACRLAREHHPDVVVIDINMPVLDGVQATRQLMTDLPDTGVIILTMHRQDQYVFEAIKAGARAYMLKDTDSEDLLQAIRTVASGEAVLTSAIALRMIEEFRRQQNDPSGADGITQLTEREQDILRLVAQGMDNNEISDRLGLSEKTVRNRMTVIFEKLHVNNRVQAALYALRRGLVKLDDHDE